MSKQENLKQVARLVEKYEKIRFLNVIITK